MIGTNVLKRKWKQLKGKNNLLQPHDQRHPRTTYKSHDYIYIYKCSTSIKEWTKTFKNIEINGLDLLKYTLHGILKYDQFHKNWTLFFYDVVYQSVNIAP